MVQRDYLDSYEFVPKAMFPSEREGFCYVKMWGGVKEVLIEEAIALAGVDKEFYIEDVLEPIFRDV